jgi:hypothetical protein
MWLNNACIAARAGMGFSNSMLRRPAVFRGSSAIVRWLRYGGYARNRCNGAGQSEGQS